MSAVGAMLGSASHAIAAHPVIAHSSAAHAATHAATKTAPASPGLAGAFFALLLVVALIVALAWLLRKMPGLGLRSAPGLQLVASLAVGAKERLVVVSVGREQLLLGVGSNGIHNLYHLSEPLPMPVPTTAPTFADLLAGLRIKGR